MLQLFGTVFPRSLAVALQIVLLCGSLSARQVRGTIQGRVADEQKGAIVNADVVVKDASGLERRTKTNSRGEYIVSDLAPGMYTVTVTFFGFATYETTDVEIKAGVQQKLDIQMQVAITPQEVEVSTGKSLSTDIANNANAVVLRGRDLEVLPEDPDELTNALRAMAGGVVGPNGIQFSVDGFTDSGQPLPSRANIREVRINQNPFSAENDRLGFGVVQIFTRPGTQDLHGDAAVIFSDESLNSRNPFAQNRAPYQLRTYFGTLTGKIIPKKASYFVNVTRREVDDNDIVNATILDPMLNINPLQLAVLVPQRRTGGNARLDYQLNQQHTLLARYSFLRATSDNLGVGGFSLPERGYSSSNNIHTLQLTETAIVNSSVVTEFRLQFIHENRIDNGNNLLPTISVLGAFTSGAPPVGPSSNPETRWWLQNNTTWVTGRNTVRTGVRLRYSKIEDVSPDNFGGTFTFEGGLVPRLNSNNEPDLDGNGDFILVPVTSLERYRRTLLFQQRGLSPAAIRQLGGGASQFSIAGGNAEADTSQVDVGAFIQDDWRLRPSFTFSYGLRFETQTNIGPHLNFAPRLAFAWAPGAQVNRPARTVVRGGGGIFYDRFAEGFTVLSNRFNGINQKQFVVSDPAVLDLFPHVPPISLLASDPDFLQTLIQIAPNLREPYTIQCVFSVERQLPRRTTATVNFVATRSLHLLRSRNINAPLPGTFIPGVPTSGVRPFGGIGNILEYESSARLNQKQLILSVNSQLTKKIAFFANYTLNKAESDSDGIQTFPANSYDLTTEYGRALFDVRHVFFFGGTFEIPLGFSLNPLVIINSGRPFNITTGVDTNGDTLFLERPAFATDLNKIGVIATRFGTFDPSPEAGQRIIPRNFAEGPGYLSVNLNINRAFKFGKPPVKAAAPQVGQTANRPPARGEEKPYTLNFSVRVMNLLNNTNPNTPVGILSSPRFGQSVSSAGAFGPGSGNPSAGNRRIETQLRFVF